MRQSIAPYPYKSTSGSTSQIAVYPEYRSGECRCESSPLNHPYIAARSVPSGCSMMDRQKIGPGAGAWPSRRSPAERGSRPFRTLPFGRRRLTRSGGRGNSLVDRQRARWAWPRPGSRRCAVDGPWESRSVAAAAGDGGDVQCTLPVPLGVSRLHAARAPSTEERKGPGTVICLNAPDASPKARRRKAAREAS